MTEPTDGRGTALAEVPRVAPPATEQKPCAERKANVPIPFDRGLIEDIHVDVQAVQRRVATLPTRRTWKKEEQVADYVWAIRCCDHTILSGAGTPDAVKRVCVKGLNPVRRDILDALGIGDIDLTVFAVCVYPSQVAEAKERTEGRVRVASVGTGFPHGQVSEEVCERDIKEALDAGADEIDNVVPGGLVQQHKWDPLYHRLVRYRQMCGDTHMKTILRIGDCTLKEAAQASAVAIMAGSDFIKTSTGMEKVNATLAGCLVMARQIRRFQDLGLLNGRLVGLKAAGGLRQAKDAQQYFVLMEQELGVLWTQPRLFRFGESSLLPDMGPQLEHLANGRYSNQEHHPLG